MSQETERYQLENNGNSYLVRTPASSGGGADVEANPEGTATEDLEKLKVDETIYGLPPVVGANPVLAGTEPNLTGLQIGNTKYAIPKGYEIHTYQSNKTYTSVDTDYEQLRDDVNNLRFIKIGNYIYAPIYSSSGTVLYSNAQIDYNYRGSFRGFTLTYTSSSITIPDNTSVTISAVDTTNSIPSSIAKGIKIGQSEVAFLGKETYYQTTAPSADNTSGYLKFVVLTSEPATYYNGYYYIIAPST